MPPQEPAQDPTKAPDPNAAPLDDPTDSGSVINVTTSGSDDLVTDSVDPMSSTPAVESASVPVTAADSDMSTPVADSFAAETPAETPAEPDASAMSPAGETSYNSTSATEAPANVEPAASETVTPAADPAGMAPAGTDSSMPLHPMENTANNSKKGLMIAAIIGVVVIVIILVVVLLARGSKSSTNTTTTPSNTTTM
ncbi:MAG: hypothetical protein WCJ24_01610 [Candidatus Saccharibacteria bacterium]